MQRRTIVVLAFGLLLASTTLAGAKCGDRPSDAASVTAIEAAVAAQCRCCGPRATYAACVASVVRAAVRGGTLAPRCAGPVRRDAQAACPLRPTTVPCRTCNSDADCAATQFCECPAGSCSETGGLCVARPEACPTLFDPVCGCDGTTYSNDCERQRAGACRAHAGPCSASGCKTNADCDDRNPCTVDQCTNGQCEHGCVCVSPATGSTCCGPGPLCIRPCGDTFPTCDGSCAAGSSCTSLTGAPACQCVPTTCQPGDGKYFYTCGDPVCGGPRGYPGVAACTTEQAGTPCTCVGAECDPGDGCNRLLECATSDPTHGGICPISRRRYKKDIQYLSADEVKRIHADVLNLRLASYKYNLPGASPASHLGFIIDDVGPSPAVSGDTVDLYGYTSMAVAAVQEQAREIDALKREVERLRSELVATKGNARRR